MTKNDFINYLFGAAGLIGVGYSICAYMKFSKVSNRLDKSINDLADGMDIDIPEELVNKAVEKAVQAEAKRAVERATNETISAMKNDIHIKVQKEVDNEYESIKDSVLKEITVSASKIDAVKVRRDVEEAAKEAALDKFNDNLDDILEKFNESLNNTSKIYSSIRDAITRDSSSGKNFVVRLD